MAEILVIPATAIATPTLPAAWPLNDLSPLAQCSWREREPCECDQSWLQLIPYVLLQDNAGRFWCYCRTGGDPRLLERRSCGLGGHVEREDQTDTVMQTLLNCARRELDEELADSQAVEILQPSAWLYEGESAIGRVHLGVIFTAQWQAQKPPQIAAGEPMQGLGFHSPEEIIAEPRFEHWSRLAAHWIKEHP
jgi:predicted NUDIX family phosphoesterase